MFVKRLLSGVVLIAVMGIAFAFGGYLLSALLMLISIVGYFELVKALCSETEKRSVNGPDLIAVIFIVLYYMAINFSSDNTYLIIGIGGFKSIFDVLICSFLVVSRINWLNLLISRTGLP